MTDYYSILELDKSSSEEDIKKSYKRLSKKWHPDKNPDNKEEATEKFKQIAEAYAVLSDKEKRAIYDEHGIDGLKESESGVPSGFNPMDIFQHFINMNTSVHRRTDTDLTCQIHCTLEQMYNGAVVEKEIKRYTLCDKCNGSGSKTGKKKQCKPCNGAGFRRIQIGPMTVAQTACESCRGTGISGEPCPDCRGKQYSVETTNVSVTIPKGVFNGYPIRVKNQGHAIPPDNVEDDNKRYDAVFVVTESNDHPLFKRGVVVPGKKGIDPSDLLIELDITFTESLLGFTRELIHLDKHVVSLYISDPTRHGDMVVVLKEGMPKINKHDSDSDSDSEGDSKVVNKGDLFIKISVEHPSKIMNETLKRNLTISLTGKEKYKLKKDKTSVEAILFDKYKETIKIQNDSDALKEEYHRKKGNHRDDDDDDNHHHEHSSQGECRQM